VVADTGVISPPGNFGSTGVYAFQPTRRRWTPLPLPPARDLRAEGSALWIASGDVQLRAPGERDTGAGQRYTPDSGHLLHRSAAAVAVTGPGVWVAMLGDYVAARKDFEGGGVSTWDRSSGRRRSFTTRDGLARSYVCDVAADEREVWATHWDEARGLSVLPRASERWRAVPRSADGALVGGVVLALEPRAVWIGQQGGLVRLDRATRRATVWRPPPLPGSIVSGIAVGDDAVWVTAYTMSGGDVARSAGLVRLPRGSVTP
jgi:hypothetical protein